MVGYRYGVWLTLCWVLLYVAQARGLKKVDAGQARNFSPDDAPVSVTSVQSQVSAGSTDISRCLSSSKPTTFAVRFQILQGKGVSFNRTLLSKENISSYATETKTVDMTTIAICLAVAEAEGFVGFSFNDGACYLFKIPPQTSGCETGGQDVFFVQDSYWAPGGRPGLFSLNLKHGLSSIFVEWQPCCTLSPSPAAKFQLSWNNKIIVLNGTTLNYTLESDASLCTDNLSQVTAALKNVSFAAYDATGSLMKIANATLTGRTDLSGTRYLLKSSNCLYYDDARGATYEKLEKFCRTEVYSTMFIEYVDGDFVTYRNDLITMESYTPPVEVYYHYAGLRKVGLAWFWLSGLPQAVIDQEVWAAISINDEMCAEVQPSVSDHKIMQLHCTDAGEAWVCHDYLR